MEEREKILSDIAALEERENYYQQQVDSASDRATADAFSKELEDAKAKIASKKEQLDQLVNASAKAQGELFSQFDNITIGDSTLTLRELSTNEQAYQILNMWFQQYVGDMAQKNATIVASYQSQLEKLQEDVAEIDSLRKELFETKEQLADVETKRDAAATELLESEEEKKRLAADNESLRKQLESTSKPSQTNLNTNLADLAKEWNNKKPAITNKRWKDANNKTTYLAELATTGETIQFGWLEAGSYREVTAEEAETFRVEDQPVVEEDVVQSEPLVTEPPAIPSEEDATVQADTTPGEMVPEVVTRDEFEALRADVESLKRTLNIDKAA